MLHEDIAEVSLKALTSAGFKNTDRPARYRQSHNLKSVITSNLPGRQIEVETAGMIFITVSIGDYIEAVFNDLHYGQVRIEQQRRNVAHLVNGGAQAAWMLVTAYYAAYFCANDLSKANGRFVTTLEDTEYSDLLSHAPALMATATVETYNTFVVTAEPGGMSGEVLLTLRKSSPKPHQLAWANLSQVINKIKINDERFLALTLFKSIISPERNGWDSPSTIRNTWNYNHPRYFDEQGTAIARTFFSTISSEKSAYRWAQNNNLRPSDENIAASIAYIYHTLCGAHKAFAQRLLIR